ncbi:hypothetical protein PPTG_24972 [Phytophthora nicotianae INRA-310]|uniref:Uncharacterized protein n=3 Tax=Phytophthora nicotianae TaxID=4792 RepID=W2P8R4_PHYN3|nr:hypothetical protein PPTG_24972 [Phytophthora nicotianae INRA-310]ETI39559.1 hypothetical protein F443_14857 [Phytophthora nicotianae P1569]ETM97397.1 hypothetical protein PPTG_24972 [Phytophthora nicotianae INRA-310]ETO81406.1 hypothetical protein F444_04278 [Phytophthora nicotianae P1976]
MVLVKLVSSATSAINAHGGLHWSFLSCDKLLLSFDILISATSIVLGGSGHCPRLEPVTVAENSMGYSAANAQVNTHVCEEAQFA